MPQSTDTVSGPLFYLNSVVHISKFFSDSGSKSIGKCTGEIEDVDYADGIFEVTGDETTEAFLPSCIPQLQPIVLALISNVLAKEVNANGGLQSTFALTFAFS